MSPWCCCSSVLSLFFLSVCCLFFRFTFPICYSVELRGVPRRTNWQFYVQFDTLRQLISTGLNTLDNGPPAVVGPVSMIALSPGSLGSLLPGDRGFVTRGHVECCFPVIHCALLFCRSSSLVSPGACRPFCLHKEANDVSSSTAPTLLPPSSSPL